MFELATFGIEILEGIDVAKWMRPSEEMPDYESFDVGDRICGIVVEIFRGEQRPRPRLVILEATEDGWHAIEDFYDGYTPRDCVLWTTEKDLCQVAAIVEN